ncbi:putative bacteriophage DNA-binding protein [Burkholderia pseudomallei MSHR2138]|nr:putative bacteriophage DNA-binding protein [Burkholderia pseudomallei MSHR2138]
MRNSTQFLLQVIEPCAPLLLSNRRSGKHCMARNAMTFKPRSDGTIPRSAAF